MKKQLCTLQINLYNKNNLIPKSLGFALLLVAVFILMAILVGCNSRNMQSNSSMSILSVSTSGTIETSPTFSGPPGSPGSGGNLPKVYMTTNITPAGLMAVYEALGRNPTGRVAVKIHTGEPGNKHFVNPNLIRNLVQKINGTFIETNTAYGGRRASAALHMQVARDHGFAAVAPVVILDERGDISLPVRGKHLRESLVGSRFNEYDFHVVISHFKGHGMGGFGGALKNVSIGYASARGKLLIHSAGATSARWASAPQNNFVESMAEAAKAVLDAAGSNNFIYINVLNHLSVDCDCVGSPATPQMADIGILASLDPVALDMASVDLIYAAPDGTALTRRIESRNGAHILTHAEELGLGSKKYQLINIDA